MAEEIIMKKICSISLDENLYDIIKRKSEANHLNLSTYLNILLWEVLGKKNSESKTKDES